MNKSMKHLKNMFIHFKIVILFQVKTVNNIYKRVKINHNMLKNKFQLLRYHKFNIKLETLLLVKIYKIYLKCFHQIKKDV